FPNRISYLLLRPALRRAARKRTIRPPLPSVNTRFPLFYCQSGKSLSGKIFPQITFSASSRNGNQ
ncbi:MAG: hypothetical protein ACN6N0_16835, partial [Microvirgula sp.]